MQSESLEFSLLSIFSFLSFFTFFIIQKFSHKIMDGLLLDSDFYKPQAFHKKRRFFRTTYGFELYFWMLFALSKKAGSV